MTCKVTWIHLLIIRFFISSSSFYINYDRGLGLGLDTCGLGLVSVLDDMVLITSLLDK